MCFDYAGHRINILDTPAHQNFAEDTYRTLAAVDTAIVVPLATSSARIQELHIKVLHTVIGAVERWLFPANYAG